MMTTARELTNKRCLPCEGLTQALAPEACAVYLKALPGWKLSADGKSIEREFLMKNFMASIRFINAVAKLAEEENHHPDFRLSGYRKLVIELSTHAISGLSENDFIEAAKIDQLPVELKTQ